jgi:hypothetical protein
MILDSYRGENTVAASWLVVFITPVVSSFAECGTVAGLERC